VTLSLASFRIVVQPTGHREFPVIGGLNHINRSNSLDSRLHVKVSKKMPA